MAKDDKPDDDNAGGDKAAGFSNFSGAKDDGPGNDRSAGDKPASISHFSNISSAERGNADDRNTAGNESATISDFSGAEELGTEPPDDLTRKLPPANSFPINSFGPTMKSAVIAIHDLTQAAVPICAQAVLAAAALACQALRDVMLPTGETRPLSLFLLSIAESGDRKSSADRHAMRAIKEFENTLSNKYEAELFVFNNDMEAWKKSREKVTTKKTGSRDSIKAELDEIGPPPTPPLEPIITFQDPTLEGLFKLLSIGWPSVGVFTSEAGQFIGGHAMGKDHRIKTAAGLCNLWDAEIIKRVRVVDGFYALKGRRFTAHMMAQPGVAQLFTSDAALRDQGLLSRFLVAFPESPAGTRFWHDPAPESEPAVAAFAARVLALLQQELPLAEGKTNELQPIAIGMNVHAKEAWKKYCDEIESKIGSEGELRPIKGLANKAPEHAARIAAVMSIFEDRLTPAGEISADGLAAAITIMNYYLAEALRLFEAGQVSSHIKLCQDVRNWIHNHWEGDYISLPDMYQGAPRPARNKAAAEEVVKTLVWHRWLLPVKPREIKGKLRTQVYWIDRTKPGDL